MADRETKREKKSRQGGSGLALKLGLILGGVGCLGVVVIGAVVAIVIVVIGARTPAWEFGGVWPEPMQLAGNPTTIVTFHIAGVDDQYTREEIIAKMPSLADPGNLRQTASAHEGSRLTVRLTPCADADACAKKVDFGTVKFVAGRMITVVANKVQGPAGNDQVSIALYYLTKSSLKNKRGDALRDLRKIQPNERRPEVTKALEGLLADPDLFTRSDAVETYAVWATKENTPALLNALKDKEHLVRGKVMEALGRMKDERAIEPLAERLADFPDRGGAANALRAFGPAAEKAVLAQVNHRDNDVRVEACRILATIGTAQSVPTLQQLAAGKDFFLKNAAEDTLRKIQGKK